MIVIVRLDLDKYDVRTIERLATDGLITIGEASEARVIRMMTDLERLVWVRKVQASRPVRKAG